MRQYQYDPDRPIYETRPKHCYTGEHLDPMAEVTRISIGNAERIDLITLRFEQVIDTRGDTQAFRDRLQSDIQKQSEAFYRSGAAFYGTRPRRLCSSCPV